MPLDNHDNLFLEDPLDSYIVDRNLRVKSVVDKENGQDKKSELKQLVPVQIFEDVRNAINKVFESGAPLKFLSESYSIYGTVTPYNGYVILSLDRQHDVSAIVENRFKILRESLLNISNAVIDARNLYELFKTIHLEVQKLAPARNFSIALRKMRGEYKNGETLTAIRTSDKDFSDQVLFFPYYVDDADSQPSEIEISGSDNELINVLKNRTELVNYRLDDEELSVDLHLPLIIKNDTDEDVPMGVLSLRDFKGSKDDIDYVVQVLLLVSTEISHAINNKIKNEMAKRENKQRIATEKRKYLHSLARNICSRLGNILFAIEQTYKLNGESVKNLNEHLLSLNALFAFHEKHPNEVTGKRIVQHVSVINKHMQALCAEGDSASLPIKDGLNLLTELREYLDDENEVISTFMIKPELTDLTREYTRKAKDSKKSFIFVCDVSDEAIEGNRSQLRYIFKTFLNNAFEANNSKNIEFIVRGEADNIKVLIKDDGDGISKENLKKFGEEFFSEKGNRSGISAVASVEQIKKMHGSITVDSSCVNKSIQRGTVIKIQLPTSSKDVQSIANPSISLAPILFKPEITEIEASNHRMLFLDDEASNHKLLDKYFKKHGFHNIDHSNTVEDAIEKVNLGCYDTIIIDDKLQNGHHGVELIEFLKKEFSAEQFSQINIIIFTASLPSSNLHCPIKKAKKLGATYFEKSSDNFDKMRTQILKKYRHKIENFDDYLDRDVPTPQPEKVSLRERGIIHWLSEIIHRANNYLISITFLSPCDLGEDDISDAKGAMERLEILTDNLNQMCKDYEKSSTIDITKLNVDMIFGKGNIVRQFKALNNALSDYPYDDDDDIKILSPKSCFDFVIDKTKIARFVESSALYIITVNPVLAKIKVRLNDLEKYSSNPVICKTIVNDILSLAKEIELIHGLITGRLPLSETTDQRKYLIEAVLSS